MHRSVDAPRASDGVADVGGQLEGSEAHEGACSSGVGHVEVQRTCEVHDQMVGRIAAYPEGCKGDVDMDQ